MVLTGRLLRWLSAPRLLERFFHPRELEAALSKSAKNAGGTRSAESLAARFAAKEAFGKALGTGLAGIVLKDIIVVNGNNGKPELQVVNTALAALEKSGANRIHLSLTHEREYAAAVVVLEVL